jgi:hypothetical protein
MVHGARSTAQLPVQLRLPPHSDVLGIQLAAVALAGNLQGSLRQ